MILLFSVDELIDHIAILENIITKEKKEVDISLLPNNVREGSILRYDNYCYSLDLDEEERRRVEFRERLEKLKKIDQ